MRAACLHVRCFPRKHCLSSSRKRLLSGAEHIGSRSAWLACFASSNHADRPSCRSPYLGYLPHSAGDGGIHRWSCSRAMRPASRGDRPLSRQTLSRSSCSYVTHPLPCSCSHSRSSSGLARGGSVVTTCGAAPGRAQAAWPSTCPRTRCSVAPDPPQPCAACTPRTTPARALAPCARRNAHVRSPDTSRTSDGPQ